jgi:acetyl esterase/lipase
VLTAECDPLRTEGEKFADRLATFAVPVEYRSFPVSREYRPAFKPT